MNFRRATLLFVLLLTCVEFRDAMGQNDRTGACVTFSADGAAVTGTIRNGELTTHLEEPGSPADTIHSVVGNASRCEEAFSNDGRWIAIVVPSDKLTVLIVDRKTRAIHNRFSSEWHGFHNMPFEPLYQSPFLGGFLDDGSLVLWRYVPQKGATDSDASSLDMHLQRWTVQGELLSEEDLGAPGSEPRGRGPLTANHMHQLWIPGGCGLGCYRGFSLETNKLVEDGSLHFQKANAATPVDIFTAKRLLSIVGDRTDQQAVLFDYEGKVESNVALPYTPNFFGPLVPDWYYTHELQPSSDDEIAVVGRTRVAWILVDTDRDWGSEIVLIKLNPLGVLATLKTGKGGIRALAVDHRNGTSHVLGFWKQRWHDLNSSDNHPGKWREMTGWGS